MTHERRRLHPVATAIAAAALLASGALAGCGDDDTATEPAGEAAAVTAAGDGVVTVVPGHRLVDPAAFATLLEQTPDAFVVNVHTPHSGDLPGTDLATAYDDLDLDKFPDDFDAPLFVYCRTDHMSGIAAVTLIEAGYTDIVELDGGYEAWIAAGLPFDA